MESIRRPDKRFAFIALPLPMVCLFLLVSALLLISRADRFQQIDLICLIIVLLFSVEFIQFIGRLKALACSMKSRSSQIDHPNMNCNCNCGEVFAFRYLSFHSFYFYFFVNFFFLFCFFFLNFFNLKTTKKQKIINKKSSFLILF